MKEGFRDCPLLFHFCLLIESQGDASSHQKLLCHHEERSHLVSKTNKSRSHPKEIRHPILSLCHFPVDLSGNNSLSAFLSVTFGDFKLGWTKVIQKSYTTHPGTSEVELKSLKMVHVILRKLGAKRSGAS